MHWLRVQEEEEDSSTVLTFFVVISILQVFGRICSVNERLENYRQESRKEYKAVTLCATSSTSPLARCVAGLQCKHCERQCVNTV